MKIFLTHSKTLDFGPWDWEGEVDVPQFLEMSKELVDKVKKMSVEEIMVYMKVSEKIAIGTLERFERIVFSFDSGNAKPALLAYKGDVFRDFSLSEYTKEDFDFAEEHLRIFSGLYGVLRPQDLIQPYRMEMKLTSQFWKEVMTEYFVEEDVIIDLASRESTAAIDFKRLKGRVVTPIFKDFNEKGKLRIVAIYSKYMRGNMADWIIREKVLDVEKLKSFDHEGYVFDESLSSENEFVFVR